MRTSLLLALATLGLAACGEPAAPPPATKGGAAKAAPPAEADHGATVDLGRLTLAGHELAVVRLGDVVPGKEAAFEATLVKGPAGATISSISVYAWVESQDGTQASAPSKGSVEGGKLHFHATPKAGAKDLRRVVLRLRAGSVDERAGLPLDGHGHEHGATPHEGVVAALKGPDGTVVGHIELKLHDDKGDLELWIAKDAKIEQPFDVPLDAKVRVEFVDVGRRTVELRVRDTARNEDEAGTANVRAGKTNYFIFPGDTGADASWLKGAQFSSIVRVTVTADGKDHVSEEFMLVPHTHADGSGH